MKEPEITNNDVHKREEDSNQLFKKENELFSNLDFSDKSLIHKDKLKIHTSSKSNEWETPKDFFKKYDDVFHFDIDVAATKENHLVNKYWTIEDDALIKDWGKMVCWMNPPYGREIGKFVKKAYEESLKGSTVVCLVPSRTDTTWWHNYCMEGEIEFIRGRLKFINLTFPSWREDGNFKVSPAPFPCSVVTFRGKN